MTVHTKINLRSAQPPTLPFSTAIEMFLDAGKAKNLATRTLEFYQSRLKAFTRFMEQQQIQPLLSAITPELIRAWLKEAIETISAVTARHSYVTLHAFFTFLVAESIIHDSPMRGISSVKVPKKVIETFTIEQIQAMLATCERTFTGLRARAIILTLLDCGLRVSELCALELDDIDWNQQTFRVHGKGNAERIVPFGNAAKHALQQYLGRRGHLDGITQVFVSCYGDPMNRKSALDVVKHYAHRAHIVGVRCSPHTFRHTFAILFLRNGGDVFSLQRLLGHSDLAMTRHYAELAFSDVLEKHRRFSPADLLPLPPASRRKRIR